MMKNIEFIPSSKKTELVVPYPKPAINYLPNFYKKYHKKDDKYNFDDFGQVDNKSAKRCMPFFDSFAMGYIQETWCDIYIENENGYPKYHYPVSPQIVAIRDSVSFNDMNPQGYFYETEFIWKSEWIPKVDKGYSILVTHPLNRTDLPFYTMSGVIDSDDFYHTPSGGIPFYIKNNFSGIIPAGTPMYQIIPIKRETWKGAAKDFNEEKMLKNNFKIRKNFISSYKKNFWKRKNYV